MGSTIWNGSGWVSPDPGWGDRERAREARDLERASRNSAYDMQAQERAREHRERRAQRKARRSGISQTPELANTSPYFVWAQHPCADLELYKRFDLSDRLQQAATWSFELCRSHLERNLDEVHIRDCCSSAALWMTAAWWFAWETTSPEELYAWYRQAICQPEEALQISGSSYLRWGVIS